MADTLEHPDQASTEELLAAVEQDTKRHLAEATLPDDTIVIPVAEARQLLAEFRRVRDVHRGRYGASIGELRADAVRIATAIATLAEFATPEERKQQLEDLVDLQSFVPDPPAALVAPPIGSIEAPLDVTEADPLLESIRWRQASLMAFAMGHASVIGDHNAIRGRWTPIGDARAAIDLVNVYRESQAGGFAAMAAWPIGTLVGLGLAIVTGNARPSIVSIVVLGFGLLAAPYLGAAVGLVEARLERSAFRRSHPGITGRFEVVFGLGVIALVPFIVGIAVTILASRLGLP